MFIDGFGLSAYRSFGDTLQFIGPCKKVNIIIGQNNSGKSNILRFLKNHFVSFKSMTYQSGQLNFSDLDRHQVRNSGIVKIAFGVDLKGSLYNAILERKGLQSREKSRALNLVNRFLRFEELPSLNDFVWFIYESRNGDIFTFPKDIIELIVNRRLAHNSNEDGAFSYRDWLYLVEAITNTSYRGVNEDILRDSLVKVMRTLSPVNIQSPEVILIDAVRQIRLDESKEDHDFSGLNIVKKLAMLERPNAGPKYDESRARFKTINHFLVDVTGVSDISLEVPASAETIHVRQGNTTLPLENLGMGIHEVIILAVAATLIEDQIVCIEEPEIHLHPVLQKKLINYLNKHTSNQYFITTHSAAMIDSPEVAVFHVRKDGEKSLVTRVITPSERFQASTDLGYRASDILQSNCIFWVEGPSDRLYLRFWLNSIDPDLIEGIHYSIMFYGGRLLSHLSANDEEVEDFINLRNINRNLAILIDSDRPNKHAPMNATKRRVRDEFNQGPGFAWVTAGREIENYIAPDLVMRVLRDIYPSAESLTSEGQFEHRYHFVRKGISEKECADKMKLARGVISTKADFGVLDLQEKVGRAARFIRQCNDLPL